MKRLAFITLIVITLQGCSTMGMIDYLNPLKKDGGLEVSTQLGENNTQIQTDNKSLIASNDKVDVTNDTTSNNSANVVNQAVNTSSDKSTISTKSTSNTTNDNKADVINQDTSSITNYPTPVWLILAFAAMAGIAIPNPFDYFSERRVRKERNGARELLLAEIDYLREELSGNNKTDTNEDRKVGNGTVAKDIELGTALDCYIDDTSERSRVDNRRKQTYKPRATI